MNRLNQPIDVAALIPLNPHHRVLLQRALPYLWSVEMGPATEQDLRDLIQGILVALGLNDADTKLLQVPPCYTK